MIILSSLHQLVYPNISPQRRLQFHRSCFIIGRQPGSDFEPSADGSVQASGISAGRWNTMEPAAGQSQSGLKCRLLIWSPTFVAQLWVLICCMQAEKRWLGEEEVVVVRGGGDG